MNFFSRKHRSECNVHLDCVEQVLHRWLHQRLSGRQVERTLAQDDYRRCRREAEALKIRATSLGDTSICATVRNLSSRGTDRDRRLRQGILKDFNILAPVAVRESFFSLLQSSRMGPMAPQNFGPVF